jgi:hypothetical protein
MRARAFVSSLGISVLLVSASTRALAAGDEPEGGAAPTSTPSATTTTDGTATPVEPLETTTVQAAPPVEAAPAKPIPLIDERTAYMVGRHTLKLGILAFEYGILQQLSIGTAPPAWVLRSVIDILIINLHLKYQILDRDPVAVAVMAAGYYGNLDKANFSGNLLDVPLSAFVSVKVHPRITLHAEGTYVYARVFGTGDLTRASLGGATAGSAGQLGLMVQYRLTRIFSLTATGRYQLWVSDLPLSGSSTIDPYTSATLSGQFVPGVQHPWEAIGGIAVLWRYVHLIVGAGYGYYFVPGLDIANTKKTFVPDASLAVVL